MIKKIVVNSLILLALASANTFAITIQNDNTQRINYTIGDSFSCKGIEYTNGEISSGGSVIWTRTTVYHPDKVCVHATGMTSSSGEFAYYVNNDSCVLRVYDAGFFRGIKIEKVSGC